MSDVFVEEWEPIEAEEPELHHMPFQICHTGASRVSSYLLIKNSGAHAHINTIPAEDPIKGIPIKEASFRGRYIKGIDIKVPEGYTGVVFREEEGDGIGRIADLFESNPNEISADEFNDLQRSSNLRTWIVQNYFSKYMYWTRNQKPSSSDKHVKWLEWTTQLSKPIHRILTAEDIKKPLKFTLEMDPIDNDKEGQKEEQIAENKQQNESKSNVTKETNPVEPSTKESVAIDSSSSTSIELDDENTKRGLKRKAPSSSDENDESSEPPSKKIAKS